MHAKDFEKLLKGVKEAGEIVRGERAPSREFTIDAVTVRKVRDATGLSQANFARIINVQV